MNPPKPSRPAQAKLKAFDQAQADPEPPFIPEKTPAELEALAKSILGPVNLPRYYKGRIHRPEYDANALDQQRREHYEPLRDAYRQRQRLYAERRKAKRDGTPVPPLPPSNIMALRKQLLATLPQAPKPILDFSDRTPTEDQ